MQDLIILMPPVMLISALYLELIPAQWYHWLAPSGPIANIIAVSSICWITAAWWFYYGQTNSVIAAIRTGVTAVVIGVLSFFSITILSWIVWQVFVRGILLSK